MDCGKEVGFIILYALVAFAASLAIFCFCIEPNLVETSVISIADDNLCALFNNKKFVQVSDLHIASVGYREKRLVKMLNASNPDILFITGDFLKEGKDGDLCLEVLGRIKRPPFGIWAVLGNTDRYEKNGLKADIDGFIDRLGQLGIRVLEDECEGVDLDGNGTLYVAGIEGRYLSRSKLNWLMRDIPQNASVILLSHYPDIIDRHSDALVINLEEYEGAGISGWGWQDNAFFEHDEGVVQFERNGLHKLRVQRREDGAAIEQIRLVPSNKSRHEDTIVIRSQDIPDSHIHGSWKKVEDPTASINPVLKDMPDLGVKNDFPLMEPEHYFEVCFFAKGDVDYHAWVKMKAHNDSISSDSVYLQFDDSINQQGEPVYRMGEFGVREKLKEVDLILAGHSHGGQVRFPAMGALDIIPGHDITYDMGLFECQGTKMYVNRGIGTTLLPIRFLCPPEITLFQFKKVKEA